MQQGTQRAATDGRRAVLFTLFALLALLLTGLNTPNAGLSGNWLPELQPTFTVAAAALNEADSSRDSEQAPLYRLCLASAVCFAFLPPAMIPLMSSTQRASYAPPHSEYVLAKCHRLPPDQPPRSAIRTV